MKKFKLLLVALAVIALTVLCFTACNLLKPLHGTQYSCEVEGHQWERMGSQDPYCKSEGFIDYRCVICSEMKTEIIPQLSHNEVVVDEIPPTCNEGGYTSYTYCDRCGYCFSEPQYISSLDHPNTHIENARESTCTQRGYSGDTICDDCGLVVQIGTMTDYIPHTYITVEGYEATCTEDGLTDHIYCDACDYVYQYQQVIPAGHLIEIEYAVDPFCNTPGHTEAEWCSRCETYIVEPVEIPALEHSTYVVQEGYEATCTTDGRTDRISCNRCNNYTVGWEVIPAGHKEEAIPAVNATCSAYGYTAGKKCSECGTVTLEPQPIAMINHSRFKTLAGYSATCYASGLTEGKACADCGIPTVTQHAIPALGHIFGDDGHCTGCELVVTDCLEYETRHSGESYCVLGFKDGYGDGISQLVIPPTYNGKPVSEIADNAFAGRSDLKSVILPESILSIGNNSFTGCTLDYIEVKDAAYYENLKGQSWFARCEIKEVRFASFNGMTPYQVYLAAMNKISHNLTRYQMNTNGTTHIIMDGVSYKANTLNVIQKQYYNDYYVYQKSTDHMTSGSPSTVSEYYYVDEYLYLPNYKVNNYIINCMTYCSPEAFSALFLIESSDLPAFTEKYFKGASFVIKEDGNMHLTLQMNEELIGDLILDIVNVSADMTVDGCTYSYSFDTNGNILSYTSLMDYKLNGYTYSFKAESTTEFKNVGTLTSITAPSGYTDLTSECRNGHKVKECPASSATCFAYGKTAYSYCERCYAAITEYTLIEPSHNYQHGECTDCGHFENENISTGLAYRLNDEGTGYILVGIGDCTDLIVYVPQYIYGRPVLSISADAFEGTDVGQVIVGSHGWYVSLFEGCDDTTIYWD